MTLLWIIIGATVGVLAIAGAVVGGLAASDIVATIERGGAGLAEQQASTGDFDIVA